MPKELYGGLPTQQGECRICGAPVTIELIPHRSFSIAEGYTDWTERNYVYDAKRAPSPVPVEEVTGGAGGSASVEEADG